jgi:FHS family L-fucose permease-like MFS transporter
MGEKKTATQRLNLAQIFNPVGSIAGLFVAQQFILKKLQSDNIDNYQLLDDAQKIIIKTSDLMVIRNPYVILGLVIILFFILIALYKMPEGKDRTEIESIQKTFKILLKNKSYIFGVISQLFYVGAQIMCWTYIYQYAEALDISSQKASNYQFIAFILFFFGRILGTYLLKTINAGSLLMLFASFSSLTILITILAQNILGLYSLVITSFFMSVMFPTIYGIALQDLNENVSKIGAAGLVMAIVGGALMPKLQGNIIDIGGYAVNDIKILGVSEINFSFILPLICFIIVILFGKYTSKKIN